MKGYVEKDLYDKRGWSPGLWRQEPDQANWVDETSGYRCMARRHDAGYWCGYVGVPQGHPVHGSAQAAVAVGAPGGVTFAGTADLQQDSNADDVNTWWVGFDAGKPPHGQPGRNVEGSYMGLASMREHICKLAFDLKRLEEQASAPPDPGPAPQPPPEASSSATSGASGAAVTPRDDVPGSRDAAAAGARVDLELPQVPPDVITTATTTPDGQAATELAGVSKDGAGRAGPLSQPGAGVNAPGADTSDSAALRSGAATPDVQVGTGNVAEDTRGTGDTANAAPGATDQSDDSSDASGTDGSGDVTKSKKRKK